VSDDPKHGATTIHASEGGGGAGKWLLGGLAALVIAGGGYFAWKNYSPPPSDTQTAYNDTYSADQLRAGPVDSGSGANAENPASPNESAPLAPSSASRNSANASTRRASTSSSSAVPEETIGITPINATTGESATDTGDDIIVNGPPRPQWSRTPSAQRLSALYPEHAREWGREGEAQLHCTVQGDGGLACVRVEETPGGFGPAALRVARTFQHARTLPNGRDAVGSPVNLRVVFRMEDQPSRG